VPKRAHIQLIISLATVVWAILLLSQGVPLNAKLLRPYSLTVAIVIIVFLLFERWLWRIPWLERPLRHPFIFGTWKGQLSSDFVDSATEKQIEPITVYLVVRQTLSTATVRLMSSESTSETLVANLDCPSGSPAILSSIFQNVPRLAIREKSQIHYGALLLEIHGSPATQMTGFYWTDRNTKGELTLDSRVPVLFDSFEIAAQHF
jgi:hypothetical protein